MISPRNASSGFSFIEIVVVVMIMGLLITIGVPTYFNWVAKGRISTTKTNLNMLKTQIEIFKSEHGSYPTKLNDLVEKPKNEKIKNWKPYFEKLPNDGWGNEFYYKITPGGRKPYELYSYGENGPEAGTPEERISVWDL